MRDPVQRNVPSRPGGGGAAAGSGRPADEPGATGTMSIGEVLGILKPEFPDITVSKIRFLEGAGLVQPDRSASGYRKFSEDDVARLRFVLRAQRDQYLPLRVIRQRLADLEQVGGLEGPGSEPSGTGAGAGSAGAPGAAGSGAAGGAGSGSAGAAGAAEAAGSAGAAGAAGAVGAAGAAGPAEAAAATGATGGWTGAGTAGGTAAGTAGAGTAAAGPASGGAGGAAGGGAAGGAVGGAVGATAPGMQPSRAAAMFGAPPSDAQFTRDELCRAAGATVDQLMELESFGLVSARGSGDRGAWYGGDDLVLLRLARELADYGLEARHLRMYKLFAEREAALFEQVVAPLVRQRNPEARARARDTIESLAQLGGRMRDLALRSAVHGLADTRDSHR
jgi:MerR HTH family regulatory protein